MTSPSDDLDDSTVELASLGRQYRLLWLILPITAVSGAMIVLAGLRAGSDPAPGSIGVVVGIAVLALVAVIATMLEARRLGRRFRHTIDELSRTQAEIRRLLDDLPDPVELIEFLSRRFVPEVSLIAENESSTP